MAGNAAGGTVLGEDAEATRSEEEPEGESSRPPGGSRAAVAGELAGLVRSRSWREAGRLTRRAGREAARDTARATGRGTLRAGRALRPSAVWASARRHPVFAVVLVTAALLRMVTMVGYQPVMFFNDSFDYLHVAMQPYPHPLRPDGYAFMLLLLKPLHSFALVAAVQHLMGLAMGVMIYVLLRRRFGLPGWGAALAAAPPLLDAYTIQLEHLVLSDTLFTFLVVCTVTLLLWRDRPTTKVAVAVGLLIGMAWLTRSVGMPVLLGVLVYLLIRRTGWRLMATVLAACMLPVLAYMGWFKAEQGKFAITESNGIFLYARVYKFADCNKINPPVQEMPLCTEPQNRLPNSQDGIWNAASPLNRYPGTRFAPEQNATASDFSKRAILGQPTDYLRVVAYDFFRVFRWNRTVFPDRATYQQYEFGTKSTALPDWRMDNDSTAADEAVAYERGRARPRVVEPFAGVIRGYQDVFYLRGTMVGVILLIGLAGLGAMWRRLGGAAFLPWTLGTGLLLAPAATAEFDYRYILPAVPLACLAAGLAFTPEARSRVAGVLRRRGADTPAQAEPELIEEKVPEVAAK